MMATKSKKKTELENLITASEEAVEEHLDYTDDMSKEERKAFNDGAHLVINILKNYIK